MRAKTKKFSGNYQPAVFNFNFIGQVALFSGPPADWYFVDLPKDLTAELNELFADQKRGFGSLPVSASIPGLTWKTSIFPNSRSKTFMLPLKAEVRKLAGVATGDTISITLQINV